MKQLVTLYNDIPKDKFEGLSVSIIEYAAAASALQEQAERAVIDSEDMYTKGGDLIKVARSHAAKAEEVRKELKKPVLEVGKLIDGAFKPVAAQFDKVRTTIEKKMRVWKAEEDRKRREEAERRRQELEQEALEKAERATGEDQDKILDVAAEAGQKVVDDSGVGTRRGMYGSTGTRKAYHTDVVNMHDFLAFLLKESANGNVELGAIIEFRKVGLNALAKDMRAKGIEQAPGAKFIEDENIRVY